MLEMDDLAGKIFAVLKGNGLKVKIYNINGAETTNPASGRRFFVNDPNIMVTINEPSDTDSTGNIEFSKGKNTDQTVEKVQKNVRRIANEFMLNSKIKVFGKTIQPRDYAYQAKMNKDTTMMENSIKPVNHHLLSKVLQQIKRLGNAHAKTIAASLDVPLDLSEVQPVLNRLVKTGKINATPNGSGELEYSISVEEAVMENNIKIASIKESFSKMFGSMKTSQQTLENVRILVKHRTPVDENIRGSRSRHISAIFLECNGERMRFQHNYLPGARAMAQHMAHGGVMSDKVGTYISESTGQLLKLQSFNRYVTTNKLINEDSSSIVETIKETIETLRTELKKLTGVKTYETIKARLETFEREQLAEDDTSQLKDLFTIRRFDEKFEEVLPIVKQLVQEKDTFYKRIEEAAANIVTLRKELINTTPIFEFASENARLGFKLSEFALRIVENEELSTFVNKVGSKLCKESKVNEFERAIVKQVLENAKIENTTQNIKKEIKESVSLEAYFDRFDYTFLKK
jgi:hypothetical protein